VCDCHEQLERMKHFDFDEWRRRYMRWMNDNKSRVMDFFRKQDRDHDGKITRQEFIDGILQSSEWRRCTLHWLHSLACLSYGRDGVSVLLQASRYIASLVNCYHQSLL